MCVYVFDLEAWIGWWVGSLCEKILDRSIAGSQCTTRFWWSKRGPHHCTPPGDAATHLVSDIYSQGDIYFIHIYTRADIHCLGH